MERKRKKHVKKSFNLNKKFSDLISILGFLFLSIGIIYLIDLYSDFLNEIYKRFFNNQEGRISIAEFSSENFYQLILYSCPAILVMISCVVYFEKIKKWIAPILSVTVFYLINIIFNISFYCFNSNLLLYPNFFAAILLLLIPISLICYFYLQSRKSFLFFLLVFEFYISLFFLKFQFSYFFIIPTSLVFSVFFYFVAERVKSVTSFFIILFHAILLFCFFAIKKLRVEFIEEYFHLFWITSLLFYVLFFIISHSRSFYGNKNAYLFFSLVNTTFYFIVSLLLVTTRYDKIYLIYPIFVLLIFHLLSLFYLRKNKFKTLIFEKELMIAILIAILLIILFDQNGISLITSALLIVMFKHSIIKKNKLLVWLSFSSIIIMAVYFAYLLIPLLFSILNSNLILFESLFIREVMDYVLICVSLIYVTKNVNRLVDLYSINKNILKTYLEFLRGFLFITLFLLFVFSVYIFIHLLTGTFLFSGLIVFIIGSLILLVVKNSNFTTFKSSNFYIFTFLCFIFLFTLTEYFDVPISKNTYLLSSNFSFTRTVLHYIGFFFFCLIFVIVNNIILKKKFNNSFYKNFLQSFSCLVIIIVACKEYDFISILFNLYEFNSLSNLELNSLINSNQILPYSIIIVIFSLMIFVYSVINQNRFLKFFSILLVGIQLLKTFLFESYEMYQDFRVLTFFLLGIMLIIFSKTENKTKIRRKI
jgi:hypothetical protein